MFMDENKPVRIDKYLWAVRVFKTRSLATNACKMGRILINNSIVKPSRTVECNEIVTVRKPPVTYKYRIINLTGNRVSPKLVCNYLEDITPEEEKIKLDISRSDRTGYRKKGTGRPTKKERRIINRWKDSFL